jgi:hypothetical protein
MLHHRLERISVTPGASPAFWMLAAFCGALAIAVSVLATMGTGDRGTSVGLQLTGRFSLLLFWPAYAGAATAALFGSRFNILARHGRDFGLAYAAAHLVHIGLVVHIITLSGRLTLNSIMPFFAIGVAWTYLLALSSIKSISELLPPAFWRIVRNVGLEYLALVFLADLVLRRIETYDRHPLLYLPFSILLIVGTVLRQAAIAQRSSYLRTVSTSAIAFVWRRMIHGSRRSRV